MNTLSRSFRGALLASLLALPLACSDSNVGPPSDPGPGPDPTPDPTPQTGFIQVTSSTSGSDLDPDGYIVSMDGNSGRSIGRNGVTTFSDVPVGPHQVALAGLADNCAVDGSNPASTAVTGGETAAVGFAVTCDPLPIGSLEVTTTVTNNFDPDGYDVFVAASNRGDVDVEGGATFDDLPAGAQEVELRDIAPNCAVDGANPATVTIPAGGTATHAFAVACTNPPDGRIIFRVCEQIGFTCSLHVMNSDGSGQFKLYQSPGCCGTSAWSPDGDRIAFMDDVDGNWDLFVMNKDATGLRRLTTDFRDETSPAWSPDGARLAFGRRVFAGWGGDLWTLDVDGSAAASQLTDSPGLLDRQPAWSVNGSIAFARIGQGLYEANNIYAIASDGTDERMVTDTIPRQGPGDSEPGAVVYDEDSPAWHPDGARILFMRRYGPSGSDTDEFWMIDANGENSRLVYSGEHISDPSLSPDGSSIVWSGNGDDIWTVNADGTGAAMIAESGTNRLFVLPDWGP